MNEVITMETREATPIAAECGDNSHSRRNGLLCALLVAACIWMIYPVADMPFSDDFSYTKTALEFSRTGHFIYNGWATAMLGWLIPWGALFIKAFGFSFTAVRFSMLPIAMASVYVFHQTLRRFGLNPGNAILGALAMGLSPLFLPVASTYMTDMPGLFVILICIYMCQRAVAARTDREALLWLSSAMLVNVAGGTVRQIAWLGALVMVPSTAWLLRERHGMKIAGVLLWVSTLLGVVACLHWFNQQPYSVPEHVFAGPVHIGMLRHLTAQLIKAFLCLLLVISPILLAWLPIVGRLNQKARLRVVAVSAIFGLLALLLYAKGVLDYWLMPWLAYSLLITEGLELDLFAAKFWMRLGISILVVITALVFVEQMTSQGWLKLHSFTKRTAAWNELIWILGPFSLSYVILLAPRATYFFIQDRYLLGLVPTAIVVLLKLYQERVTAKLSILSVFAVSIVAVYSVGVAHDLFADCRAWAKTIQMVQTSGVSRNYIEAGFANDGWTQIDGGGHINDARIQVPAGAYKPDTPVANLPKECASWFSPYTPAVTPHYFITGSPGSCFARTEYAPIHFTTWLPPFHRAFYVQELKDNSK